MSAPDSLPEAKRRLQATREVLMHELMPSTRGRPRTVAALPDAARDIPDAARPQRAARSSASAGSASPSTWHTVRDSARAWWQYHPARTVTALVEPLLASYGRQRPWKLLGISAGIGAAVVVLRPWKMVSAGGLALAALRSSQASNFALSLLMAKRATTTKKEFHE